MKIYLELSLAFLLYLISSLVPLSKVYSVTTWLKYPSNPIIQKGTQGSWDDKFIRAGTVIYINGVYKMWYSGINSNGIEQIGLASSNNGINWQKDDNNPVLRVGSSSSWDYPVVGEPAVLIDNGTYYMWYLGYNGVNEEYKIGMATSNDGVTWNKHPSNPVLIPSSTGWDNRGIANHAVIKVSNTFQMWYNATSLSSSQPRWKIGYATSTDGVNWTKYAGNPVLQVDQAWEHNGGDGLGGPSVIYDGSKYQMWYHVSGVGYAESSDGIHWTKDANNPVVPRGTGSEWDAFYLTDPNVIKDGNVFKMWYSGWSSYSNVSVGMATSSPISSLTPSPTLTPTPTETPTPTPTPTQTPTQTPTPTTPAKSPVIIVPGTGASVNKDDLRSCNLTSSHEWQSIPLYTELVYGPLLKTLTEDAKLKTNKDVYYYSYDWRQNPDVLANNFKKYIDKIALNHPPGTKFKMIGHSLGGLVIRSYIQNNINNNKVLKALTAGTPHYGTVMSYPIWEKGSLSTIDDPLAKLAVNSLIVNCQIKSVFNPLLNNFREFKIEDFKLIKSRRQILQSIAPVFNSLLPVFDYLKENGNLIAFSNMNQKNKWLIDHPLFNPINMPLNLTISGSNHKTLEFFNITASSKIDKKRGDWIDGKPVGNEKSSQGDGTILVKSSKIAQIDNFEINGNHQDVISSKEALVKIMDFLDLPDITITKQSLVPELEDKNIVSISSDQNVTLTLYDIRRKEIETQKDIITLINPQPGENILKITPEKNANITLLLSLVVKNEEVKEKIYQIKLKKDKSAEYKLIYKPESTQPLTLSPI